MNPAVLPKGHFGLPIGCFDGSPWFVVKSGFVSLNEGGP
ncbi:hypothetical protein BJ956_000590 [Arthrobacter psychrochitiniphilus]|nr:hypothetical protein [Arthrobacter psychrochitiniphilus]